jgi:hypothetical protein
MKTEKREVVYKAAALEFVKRQSVINLLVKVVKEFLGCPNSFFRRRCTL